MAGPFAPMLAGPHLGGAYPVSQAAWPQLAPQAPERAEAATAGAPEPEGGQLAPDVDQAVRARAQGEATTRAGNTAPAFAGATR